MLKETQAAHDNVSVYTHDILQKSKTKKKTFNLIGYVMTLRNGTKQFNYKDITSSSVDLEDVIFCKVNHGLLLDEISPFYDFDE